MRTIPYVRGFFDFWRIVALYQIIKKVRDVHPT